jgi:hypothetical protein
MDARMAALMIVLLFVLAVIAAVITSICVDESKAWLAWLVNFVIERAARRLPEASRERYAEEWHSHVDEVPGTIGKLVTALSLLRADRKMSLALAGGGGHIVGKGDAGVLDDEHTRLLLATLIPRLVFTPRFQRKNVGTDIPD